MTTNEWSTHVPRVSGLYERRSWSGHVWGVELTCREGNDYALVSEAVQEGAPRAMSYGDESSAWRPMRRVLRWKFMRIRRARAGNMPEWRLRRAGAALAGFAEAALFTTAMQQLRAPFTGPRDYVGSMHGFCVACVRVALKDAYDKGYDDAY